jgi:arginine N-succinyltransferase
MFFIRQAQPDDASTLLKLAKMVHFINLPADPDIIGRRIAQSRLSFEGKARKKRERVFMFVLEDSDTGNVIGTSSIVACISWPGRPHTFLQVRKREFFSQDLQTGQVHLTLQLGTDEGGPSEIGGLILGPSYRGHTLRLGAMISLVRFHFMALNRKSFADRVIAEMMGPLTPDSRNLLWEYLGRRFINLQYAEADRFCQHSKEFITSLFPKEEIYVSLLPPEARALIGRVGPETEPARAMLENLGFRYHGQIDPFDGGPYLEAVIDEIPLVKATRTATLSERSGPFVDEGLISAVGEFGYRAVRTNYALEGDALAMAPEYAELLGLKPGAAVGVTPLKTPAEPDDGAARNAPQRERAPGERTPEERIPRPRDRASGTGSTQKVTE